MKNRFENAKVFEAYAVLDFLHYQLDAIEIDIDEPRSPIEIMIDKATGFDKRHVGTLISIMKDMIKYKKIIEMDCQKDEEFLKSLKKFKKQTLIKPNTTLII